MRFSNRQNFDDHDPGQMTDRRLPRTRASISLMHSSKIARLLSRAAALRHRLIASRAGVCKVTLAVFCLALLQITPACARAQDAAAATETIIPIRKVVLPAGGRYFALPLRVGSKDLTAAIDTGSAGLRVLSRALSDSDFHATGQPASMTFASGTTIAGLRATAELSFGALHGVAPIEVVEHASCVSTRPRCPEGHLPMSEFGLMGGGKPNQGAPAIIGLSRVDIPITAPFPALGVKRWIIDIPNDLGGGRLTLNPAPASLAGFIAFPAPIGPDGKPIGGIRGCLRNDRSGQQVCGVIVFDTGAPGISVSSPDPLPARWAPHTPASLLYKDDAGRIRLVQRFETGDPAHSSRLSFDDHPVGQQTVIHANASPYFCFDVMYEASNGPISLRPRQSGLRDPHASVVN